MPRGADVAIAPLVYLDIETDWHRSPTVVGFRSRETGVVQLIGEEISRRRLLRELPRRGRLVTFNGHTFDLPVLRDHLGCDLRERFEHTDLLYICRNVGLSGGQKVIEERIRFQRSLPDLDGRDALWLWRRHQRGDIEALPTLLRYNREDLQGMIATRMYLSRRGLRPLAVED